MGRLNRCLAVFVKSPQNALPHQVITIVAGLAAPQPILECFAMNACFLGCPPKDGTFPKALDNNQHALR